jgi:hypothetical protein
MRAVIWTAVIAAALPGCASRDEVSRVASPDRSLEAVLVEINGGATTSYGYDVYVVKKGSDLSWARSVMSAYGAVRSEEAYGLDLKWDTPEILAIQFLRAKQSKLEADHLNIGGKTVRIVIRQGVSDSLAPPGGMQYNNEGRPFDRT